jgi:hypothetical protein
MSSCRLENIEGVCEEKILLHDAMEEAEICLRIGELFSALACNFTKRNGAGDEQASFE